MRAVDTPALLELERRAADWSLNQRLPLDWLELNVDPGGRHYLQPALVHTFTHRPEVPAHWRCELLLALREGDQVLSLLDLMPEDFATVPETLTQEEKREVAERMSAARSVAEWQQDHP